MLVCCYFIVFFRYKGYLPPRLARLDPRMFCKVISECSCYTVALLWLGCFRALFSINFSICLYRRCFMPLGWMTKITSLVSPRSFFVRARYAKATFTLCIVSLNLSRNFGLLNRSEQNIASGSKEQTCFAASLSRQAFKTRSTIYNFCVLRRLKNQPGGRWGEKIMPACNTHY